MDGKKLDVPLTFSTMLEKVFSLSEKDSDLKELIENAKKEKMPMTQILCIISYFTLTVSEAKDELVKVLAKENTELKEKLLSEGGFW